MKHLFIGASLVAGLSTGAFASTASTTTPHPDNSAVNAERPLTAEDQSVSPRDAELTRKIRREITKDDSLSTYAHNIKIVTQNGNVTLIGPVETEAERNKVVATASRIAGKSVVINQLDVSGR